MSEHGLHRAYVQAWVWVELPIRTSKFAYTNEEFVNYAMEHYQQDGEIEFDSNADVSRGNELCSDCN